MDTKEAKITSQMKFIDQKSIAGMTTTGLSHSPETVKYNMLNSSASVPQMGMQTSASSFSIPLIKMKVKWVDSSKSAKKSMDPTGNDIIAA